LSRFLAIDIDQGQVHVVSGMARNGVAKVEKGATLDIGLALNSANSAEFGERLKESLKRLQIAPAPVLVTLGRDRVIVKDSKIPPVPESEEAGIVRFQAQKELTEAIDSVIIDYYPLIRPEADGQRRVAIVSVKREIIETLKAACQAAGLKLAGVTPRPLSVYSALQLAIQTGEVTAPPGRHPSIAILTRGEKWGELVIARDDQVIFSRALSATSLNSETMLLGELRRNIAVYNAQSPQQPVEVLYVPEGANSPNRLSERLRTGMTFPVEGFDPLNGVDTDISVTERGPFAALVGLLNLKSTVQQLPIDFITPRQPKVKKTGPSNLLVLAAGLSGLLIAGGLVFGYMKVNERSKELARLSAEKLDLDKQLKEMEPEEKRIKIIKEWEDKRVVWLDELYDLTDRFPDVNSTRIEMIRGNLREPDKLAKVKHVGHMKIKVQTESDRLANSLHGAMVNDKYYEVSKTPSKAFGQAAANAGRMSLFYELNVDLEKRPASSYTRRLTTTAPSSSGSDDASSPGQFFGGPGS
jgi:Tfp pilus assembly PilM family ATPase